MQLRRLAVNVAALIGCSIAAEAMGQSIPLSPTAQASGAVITHEQGIEFVTIGSPGNAPYQAADPRQRVNNRGGVNYEYRIARFEVTSAQWVDFMNAAFDRPSSDRIPFLVPPDFWGGVAATPTVSGGRRWTTTAESAMLPVGDIGWRMAAIYCNWLNNDQRSDRAAFLSGAYDVSTFSGGTVNTDQAAHSPGARFWIPTWDEWLKAAHFDPNRNGPGQGGFWNYSITSDARPIEGPPGVLSETDRLHNLPGPNPNGALAQVNGGWTSQNFPGYNPFSILLGAYPTVQSPWGLLDTAGGSSEWTESLLVINGGERYRFFDGSYREFGDVGMDHIIGGAAEFPYVDSYEFGLRIAAAVPAPGACGSVLGLVLLSARRNRR